MVKRLESTDDNIREANERPGLANHEPQPTAERPHIDSLLAVANLVALYAQSAPTFSRDKDDLSSLKGFTQQPERDVIQIET